MSGKRFVKGLVLCGLLGCLSLTAAASPVSDARERTSYDIADGAHLTVTDAAAEDRPEVLYTIEADPDRYEWLIGGSVLNKSLVQDAMLLTRREAEVVAGINGDHFSFQTGIPLGMSISNGVIITSPVEPYNADDYYFHALGIKADGEVLTGENPTLHMQYTVGEHTGTVERINRTRENWEGGQICLFTPHYGDSTGTNAAGVEFVIRVDEGAVSTQSAMRGTVVAVDEDGDAPIEDGHVVLSISLLQYDEIEAIAVGDELEFLFSFEQEEWNEVAFAVGGNRVAVENGEAQTFDYTVGAFTAAAPRSAIGVKADGTLVMAAVDGRSEQSGGLTANEMTRYLAEDLECEYAILLDGGGSTALCAKNDSGVMTTVNVPSETRPVGNSVLLVVREQTAGDTVLWAVCLSVAAIAVLAGVVVIVRLLRPKR